MPGKKRLSPCGIRSRKSGDVDAVSRAVRGVEETLGWVPCYWPDVDSPCRLAK